MVEPVSATVIGGYLAKKTVDGLGRLLGPAGSEAGRALQRFTEVRLRNVGRVIENAERKTEAQHGADGAVPLSVALRVVDEGGYAEDAMVVEYLGGVLASARTPRGRDDRGSTFLALISRLSTYHLRTHYVFYTEIRRLLQGQNIHLGDLDEIHDHGRVFVPHSVHQAALDFDDTEDADAILDHTMWWLDREQLLGWNPGGSVEYLSTRPELASYTFPAAGTIAWPTVPGAELYLWALGQGQHGLHTFLNPTHLDPPLPGIHIPSGSHRLADLNTHSSTNGA